MGREDRGHHLAPPKIRPCYLTTDRCHSAVEENKYRSLLDRNIRGLNRIGTNRRDQIVLHADYFTGLNDVKYINKKILTSECFLNFFWRT